MFLVAFRCGCGSTLEREPSRLEMGGSIPPARSTFTALE
jgi:hypothetical protein